ncbi:MAG: hypothetical protein ACRDY2_12400 [Acidimicrobiales bacterium]
MSEQTIVCGGGHVNGQSASMTLCVTARYSLPTLDFHVTSPGSSKVQADAVESAAQSFSCKVNVAVTYKVVEIDGVPILVNSLTLNALFTQCTTGSDELECVGVLASTDNGLMVPEETIGVSKGSDGFCTTLTDPETTSNVGAELEGAGGIENLATGAEGEVGPKTFILTVIPPEE